MKTVLTVIVLLICFTAAGHAQTAQKVHRGTVLSTVNVDSYTYLEVDESGKKMWIAVPIMETGVGDLVETSFGMVMEDFHSAKLNKTFKEIIFATNAKVITSAKPAAQPAATPAAATPAAATPTGPAISVKSLKELFDNKNTYNGKNVSLRGTVTKATKGVMRKNWYHITDASGTDRPLDLTVTSQSSAAAGDIVSITGMVTLNKDFGAGYLFAIIIEDALIAVEPKAK